MAFARSLRACVLLALIPTALGGCATGSGPLQFPESEGSACKMTSAAGTYWSFGDWPLTLVSDGMWAARQDAAGAVVEPGELVNLLTVVGRGQKSPDGYADAVEVRYHDSSGRRFAVTSKTRPSA